MCASANFKINATQLASHSIPCSSVLYVLYVLHCKFSSAKLILNAYTTQY